MNKFNVKIIILIVTSLLCSPLTSCSNNQRSEIILSQENEIAETFSIESNDDNLINNDDNDTNNTIKNSLTDPDDLSDKSEIYITKKIYLDFTAPYATYSIINDGYAVLYQLKKNKVSNYKNKTIAVNAGHGTKGGATVKTFAHPDFTPKVTGGSNAAGSILSAAVSAGMTFENGMTEANANLVVAYLLKDKLLDNGYSVLMIRENDDCRLDNIARTVIANENADAHVSIHFDSTTNDKGIFYIVPYNDANYLNMEPLKSNAKNIKALGDSIIEAYRDMGEKIWKDRGTLQGDLTQLSFSTNASVDIELGDRKTEVTKEKAEIFAEGLARGIDNYFNS